MDRPARRRRPAAREPRAAAGGRAADRKAPRPGPPRRWRQLNLISGADRYGNPGSWDAMTGNFIAAAAGFHGMVDRPTMFIAGEKGIESVDITPGGGRGGGGSDTYITSNGDIDSEERLDQLERRLARRMRAA